MHHAIMGFYVTDFTMRSHTQLHVHALTQWSITTLIPFPLFFSRNSVSLIINIMSRDVNPAKSGLLTLTWTYTPDQFLLCLLKIACTFPADPVLKIVLPRTTLIQMLFRNVFNCHMTVLAVCAYVSLLYLSIHLSHMSLVFIVWCYMYLCDSHVQCSGQAQNQQGEIGENQTFLVTVDFLVVSTCATGKFGAWIAQKSHGIN